MKMRSTRPMCASAAGTKLPTWANSVISATCRMKVDLPAMLGPVITSTRSLIRQFNVVGHVPAGWQDSLHHRVPAVSYTYHRAIIDHWPHVAVIDRGLSQPGEHVDLGYCG